MKIFYKAACIAALITSTSAQSELMNNSTILGLSKAGLSDDLIIAKINTESCGYDVSTNNIMAGS